ncbi:hypothetical protein [Mycolicibacter kumamotonensis]|jgi:hypothetical protein|uniref:HEPN domain-containing protein n=1 Tax=Mycolicibacter kumamotonensis TaxID=354243 RepID=A0A1B8SDZ1_9MYCO|nr:hypothetical protein [Mycolicibacter kumamotonensis]OBY30914.1 hypothetical protein ACT18_15045 [Mycolicibacter kumamotonensis]
MAGRTRSCSDAFRLGRLKKATEFLDTALLVAGQKPDAATNLFVLAGIAAADVICCARLGRYAVGENHNEAAALLKQADPTVEKHLRTLLGVKTKAAYTHLTPTTDERKKAKRAAEALAEAARRTWLPPAPPTAP